ncbi:MAG: TerB family tellurite resistance protein [Pseudomonadota bacterium]
MINNLILLFKNPEADVDLPEEAGREAVSALLVAAAKADGVYEPAEATTITEILGRHYGLPPAEAEALRNEGELSYAEAADLVRFTRAIKRVVPHEERIAVIEAIWEVAFADGSSDHTESALVRKLCGLLYVEDRDAGVARQRVKARLGID